MLSSEEWWGVIKNYNNIIFPIQWIVLGLGVIIIIYLLKSRDEYHRKMANQIFKGYMGVANIWIGVGFFIILAKDFPLPLRLSQGSLFITIGVLYIIDLFRKKMDFRLPEKRAVKTLFYILLVFLAIYSFVGAIQGKPMDEWIVMGTLPCPTTALGLVMIICLCERKPKPLMILLLIWAIPFPPLIQIPKYHVYEDGIMFTAGLIGLVVLIKSFRVKRASHKLSTES